MAEYKFSEGGLWEESYWYLHTDCEIQENPCQHCHSEQDIIIQETTYQWSKHIWICPRVIVAINEGGYNTTGVCLDCILEAATTLNEEKDKERREQ